MEKLTQPKVTAEEAAAFTQRWGLRSLRPEHMAELQEAMASIAQAGKNVPRVASKFDQPAPVFQVSSGGRKWNSGA